MAEHVEERPSVLGPPAHDPVRTVREVERTFWSFHWGSVFAGVVVALAVQILLTTFGVAVGVSTLDARPSIADWRGAGIGVGIWYLVSMLIATFSGGFVAGVVQRDATKRLGAIEGLVVWGLAVLLAMFFVGSGVQALLAQVSGAITIDPSQLAGQPPPDVPPMDEQTAQALERASTWAAWIAFGSLFLSAASAILGGITGARAREKETRRVLAPRTSSELRHPELRPSEA